MGFFTCNHESTYIVKVLKLRTFQNYKNFSLFVLQDEEKEDFIIKPDDNLIVVGHVDEDYSNLEIYGELKLFFLRILSGPQTFP